MSVERAPTVVCVCPPISDRRFDWCAYYDPEDGAYGYGATAEEALADLEERFKRVVYIALRLR